MNKTALITGASSGIGYEMAKVLSNMGYDIILVARREDKLKELQKHLKTKSIIITKDISTTQSCIDLYNEVKDLNIEVLINNAGFGLLGEFVTNDLDRELDMIDLNIKSMHTLMKLFLRKFKENDRGYILNVASSAGFMPGPLMASYYASKAYVLNLTRAVAYELRKSGSNVKVSALCPGPVDTEFNKVANIKAFGLPSLKADYVAKYSIKKMFSGKTTIVPGWKIKFAVNAPKFVPTPLMLRLTYNVQHSKNK